MKIIRYLAAAIVAVFLMPLAALAQIADAAPSTVEIPWGDWIADSASSLAMVAIAIVGWALRKLPAAWLSIIKTAQVEQLLNKAIDAGIARVAGAARGQKLTIDVANKVLAEALQYAVRNGAGALVAWAGGVDGLRDKIISRLDVNADVAMK
jgi:hypothetical protein